MSFTTGFWHSDVEGSAANMNLCLLGWGPYADFPAPAAYVSAASPGNAGALALATDRNMVYASTGTAWQQTAITPPASLAQGDIIYFNGTAWARLGYDTAGKVLQTNGAGANPSWAAAPQSIAVGGGYDFYGPLANIPSGYHLCDGAAISRSTYSVLFTLIGTTYGSGDGSTTFNIPNRVAKFAQGVATAATNPGATGGATNKTTAGHTHSIAIAANSATGSAQYNPMQNVTGSNTDTIADIRPPYLEIAPVIRII